MAGAPVLVNGSRRVLFALLLLARPAWALPTPTPTPFAFTCIDVEDSDNATVLTDSPPCTGRLDLSGYALLGGRAPHQFLFGSSTGATITDTLDLEPSTTGIVGLDAALDHPIGIFFGGNQTTLKGEGGGLVGFTPPSFDATLDPVNYVGVWIQGNTTITNDGGGSTALALFRSSPQITGNGKFIQGGSALSNNPTFVGDTGTFSIYRLLDTENHPVVTTANGGTVVIQNIIGLSESPSTSASVSTNAHIAIDNGAGLAGPLGVSVALRTSGGTNVANGQSWSLISTGGATMQQQGGAIFGVAPAITTTLAAPIVVGSTTVTLTSSSAFPSTGVILVNGAEYYTYTANNTGTGVLTLAIPSAVGHASGQGVAAVIQPTTQLDMYVLAPNQIGMFIRGAASQTADLEQWQKSDATVLSRMDALGAWHPPHLANATAQNDSFFYSTDDAKAAYKDPSGTVHDLY